MGKALLSDNDFKEAGEHIWYEFMMLEGTARYLAAPGTLDRVLKNTLLESFVTHTRIALDFLYSKNPKKDAISAVDFFSNPDDWIKLRGEKSAFLSKCHRRAHKEVAHLSWERIKMTDKSKQWEYMRIAKEILNGAWIEFLNNAPENKLHESILAEKNRLTSE